MSEYEGAEYVVLVSFGGSRSKKAHLEDLDRPGITLCGVAMFADTYRAGEDVCLRCDWIAASRDSA